MERILPAGPPAPPLPLPRLQVRAVGDAADRSAWARYINHAPAATLFHHPLWSEAVAAVFGHAPRHLLAERAGRVVGVLPLMEVRSALAGRLLVSVPYATYGGILADNEPTRDALAVEALRLTNELGARALELRSRDERLTGFRADEGYCGFERELPARPDDLATYLPRKARAAARQAREREALTVRHDAGDLALVWKLYTRSMRRLGSINYPYVFFRALRDRLGERAWVTTVWQRGRPVAGLASFVFGDTVLPYFVGVDERVRCTGATNLIYYAVMERAVATGVRRFDFGRSRRDNAGPIAFKCNQGFEPRVLGYQRYVPPGRTAPDLTPSNPRFALARRIWRHLPLPVCRWLGARLSRSIPG